MAKSFSRPRVLPNRGGLRLSDQQRKAATIWYNWYAGGGQAGTLDFHILAGQSNMKGNKSDVDNLPVRYKGEIAGVQIWNGSSFESLDVSTNNNQFPASTKDGAFGPEITYLVDQAQKTGRTQYVVKYAIGATGLAAGSSDQDWSPQSEELYTALTTAISQAAASVDGTVRIKSIFWMQGERDATNSTYADAYEENLEDFFFDSLIPFLKTIDSTVNENTIPIIVPRLHSSLPSVDYPEADTVRAAQVSFANSHANVRIIDTDYYPLNEDSIHFTDLGYLWLGHNALAKLNGNYILNEQWENANPAIVTVTDPADGVTIASGTSVPGLRISCDHAGISALFANRAEVPITEQSVSVSVWMSWNTTASQVTAHSLVLFKDSNNYIRLMARNTSDGANYRLIILQNGSSVYDFNTPHPHGSLVKITYDHETNEIRFWVIERDSSTNEWVQMGTTQVFDMDGLVSVTFTAPNNASDNGGASCDYRSLWITENDFETAFPI